MKRPFCSPRDPTAIIDGVSSGLAWATGGQPPAQQAAEAPTSAVFDALEEAGALDHLRSTFFVDASSSVEGAALVYVSMDYFEAIWMPLKRRPWNVT